MNDMMLKMQRWIRENNNCYTLQDIMDGVKEGKYQSYAFGNTWVLTQVDEFPQRKAVHIALVVGHFDEFAAGMPEIEKYARSIGSTLLTGSGRPGWWKRRDELLPGWQFRGSLYAKELNDDKS